MLKDGLKKEDLFPVITGKVNDKFNHLNKIKIIGIIAIIFIIFLLFYIFKKPSITLIGDKVEKVSYKSEFIDSGIIVKYRGNDITNKVIMSNDINTNELGEYQITYKIPYLLGNYIYIRQAIVVDDKAPEITLNGDEEYKLPNNREYKELGYKAIDNYDGDITDKVEIWQEDINDEEKEIYYKVSDQAGNIQEKVRKVYIVEPEVPVINEEDIGKSAMDVGDPGVVYLTFDDGPSNSTTPQILDILKSKGVKATFFILDYGESTEHLVKRIVDEGHTIAIHSKSHDYSVCYASADAYLNGIEEMKEKIKKTTGIETKIIRFPGGSSNTVSRKYSEGVMSFLARETIHRGYRYFDWNVSSGDSGGVKTSEGVYENVTSGLKETRSNVVLMHDFSGNQKTVDALPGIIDFATSNGYIFDRITNITPMVTHAVQN